MRVPPAVVLLASSVIHVFAANQTEHNDTDELISLGGRSQVIPNRYIVEFESDTERNHIVRSLEENGAYAVLKLFDDNDVFFGASVEAKSENTGFRSLQSNRKIKRAWPMRKIKLDSEVHKMTYNSIKDAEKYEVHNQTGVNKLHDAGILGEGVTIAVIDTGVNYKHPDLGRGFGWGHTVIGGTDLVGDGCFPEDGCGRRPDNDPMDQDGHGTHVAGILAGAGKWFTGVAPKAKILAYKVFGTAGWTTDEALILSFIEAFKAGADVITCSVGTLSGWEDMPWAVVADRIAEEGIVITLSAGNDGNYGPFLLSDGAAGQKVLAVAAIEPDLEPAPALLVHFDSNNRSWTEKVAHTGVAAPLPKLIKDWPIVYVGSGCDLPKNLNLTGKLVLVENGSCSPSVKDDELLGAGAEYALSFNPKSLENDSPFTDNWRWLQPAIVSDEDGQGMAAALKKGYEVTVTSPEEVVFVGTKNPAAGLPAYFTTLGGTYELAVKPDIAAPGSKILSLWLDNGYAVLSGTSMATPYVAGVAALYISRFGGRPKHGKGFSSILSSRILGSGKSVPWANYLGLAHKSGLLASVTQVGSGLVNATKVLDAKTQLSFTKFALNDTERFAGDHSVEVTNKGDRDVAYTFEIESAGGYEAYSYLGGEPSANMRNYIAENPLKIVPKVRVPSDGQTVRPGQKRKFRFNFEIPEGMNNTNMPLYSGKVLIKGSNGDQLSVPYFGAGGNTGKEVPNSMWYRAVNYPKLYSTYDRIPYEEKTTFTFNLDVDVQDFPKLEIGMAMGAPEVRWDIFEANWTESQWSYPPVPQERGFVGSVASWAGATAASNAVFDPKVDDITDVVNFPVEKVTRRVAIDYWWLGGFTDGSFVKPGKYRMRLAALTTFGDPKESSDWDVFKTSHIEVLEKEKT